MTRFVDEESGHLTSVRCKQATLTQLKAGGSPLAQRILKELAKGALYSHLVAKRLKVHEQKIYYHMRKLEKAGLIAEERREEIGGASAKYYRLAAPSFAVLFEEPQPTGAITALPSAERAFLSPFITDGKADFLIVVGSPEAHGPGMTQAKDGSYAIDLTLFLGSFLASRPRPAVKLDTEFTKEDWQRNLIIIGGPIVNTVAAQMNAELPIKFKEDGKTIMSTLSRKEYAHDQIGIVVKAKNPRAKSKSLLFIAGRRQAGTRAAILAFISRFDELIAGNAHAHEVMARVVEGRDEDSDGVVDAVTFNE